jgi:hypothetical protein
MHDWVFSAHHCIVQGKPDPTDIAEYDKIRLFSFEDSSALLAEVIKTLMVNDRVRPNAEAFSLITFGVDSVVARNLWNTTTADSCDPVTSAHKKLIEDALQRNTLRGFVPGLRSPRKPPLIVHSQRF